MHRMRASLLAGLACLGLSAESPLGEENPSVGRAPPADRPAPLAYRGVHHAADGKLATDLTIPKGGSFSASLEYPGAATLGLRKTWACWVFPEDTWAIGGNSELELLVDDAMVTRFAVAQGEWKVLIQSLAEHVTDRVPDPTRAYRLTLKNSGAHDVRIRELWIRWLAHL